MTSIDKVSWICVKAARFRPAKLEMATTRAKTERQGLPASCVFETSVSGSA